MTPPLCVGWWGPSHGPWEWMQGQFQRTTLLNGETIDDWLNGSHEQDRSSKKIVLLGIEHRSDTEPLDWLEQRLRATASSRRSAGTNSQIGILLGNDWHGHRRTYPIPEGIPSFYWYQWYDRIFPWLSGVIASNSEEVSVPAKRKNSRRQPVESLSSESLPYRIQWAMDQSQWQASMMGNGQHTLPLAWVITDHRDQSELWQDSCQSVGMRVVATRWDRDPPCMQPQLIVVDCVSRSGQYLSEDSGPAMELATRRAREQHPDALLAVVSPFPNWSDWSKWQALGVDAVLPRPAALQGFLFYWEQWRSQTAA